MSENMLATPGSFSTARYNARCSNMRSVRTAAKISSWAAPGGVSQRASSRCRAGEPRRTAGKPRKVPLPWTVSCLRQGRTAISATMESAHMVSSNSSRFGTSTVTRVTNFAAVWSGRHCKQNDLRFCNRSKGGAEHARPTMAKLLNDSGSLGSARSNRLPEDNCKLTDWIGSRRQAESSRPSHPLLVPPPMWQWTKCKCGSDGDASHSSCKAFALSTVIDRRPRR
mmetsp:Transcript_13228/g.33009  ORF Transcript_13228/g.33009 Transcript_13228/m.33009 type:complete len:225 (-) Transcript_13228:413-1087(-)